MYYPKSQITTNLSTNGKEFQVVGTDEYYIGSYFKTSDGRFYTGKTPQDGNNKLLIQNPINDPNNPILSINSDTNYFTNSLPPSYLNASKSELILPPPPQGNIVFPTEEDYETGEYQRYFLKHNINNIYLEVNQSTYNNFFNLNPSVQYQLYTAIQISWILVGKPIEVYEINRNIVLLYEKENKIMGFSNFFKGRYLKYYRPLKNEYYSTRGGELKVQDTNENYEGYYHVYSTRGVIMEGRFHTASPHRVLIPFKGEEMSKLKTQLMPNREVGTSIRTNIIRESGY
jgi:hypothetical protein